MATAVAALVLTTVPVYAQASAGPAMAGGMSTQEIMQAGASNPWAANAEAERAAAPAAKAPESVQAAASAPQQRSVPFWALAAWVSVGVLLAFGYLLRRRVW